MNALYIPLSIQQSIINENTVNIQLIVDRYVLAATSCWCAHCTTPIKNSRLMVRQIRGAKINPKSSFKKKDAQNTQGWKLREQIRYIPNSTPVRIKNYIEIIKISELNIFKCNIKFYKM
jgi:hypothetical protein